MTEKNKFQKAPKTSKTNKGKTNLFFTKAISPLSKEKVERNSKCFMQG